MSVFAQVVSALKRSSFAACSLAVLLIGGCTDALAQDRLEQLREFVVGPSVRQIANAVTELDVERASELFTHVKTGGDDLAFQRARLAVYVGDCDSAEAILSTVPESTESVRLMLVARSCARATAGSVVKQDTERGVWVRFQDAGDVALMPLLVEVAANARDTMVRDLGVQLPLPLRIDLVRDLFSLAAVSGLPVEAAETTGTVAVARWGRVTMITPRAPTEGYSWQDTLAHEITHLALTRGSRDFAPLWLQEGVAKREENRWRSPRPFDDERPADPIARRALLEGTSVGIDSIGPSIAMLPTAEAASISYAEVQSFMDFWIRQNGSAAFTLLLADLKGLETRDTNAVLASVTGYPLKYWIARWQSHLRSLPPPVERAAPSAHAGVNVAQNARLGGLMFDREHHARAAAYYDDAVSGAVKSPGLRYRAARAHQRAGDAVSASDILKSFEDIGGLHGGWLGLHGHFSSAQGKPQEARQDFELAISVDPFGSDAACGGLAEDELPQDPTRRRLCQAARKVVRH